MQYGGRLSELELRSRVRALLEFRSWCKIFSSSGISKNTNESQFYMYDRKGAVIVASTFF